MDLMLTCEDSVRTEKVNMLRNEYLFTHEEPTIAHHSSVLLASHDASGEDE